MKIKQGKNRYTKHFSFEKCGGKEKALEQAIEDRDRALKERGMLQYLKFDRAPNLRRQTISNDQPIIGVYKTYSYKTERTLKQWTARRSDRSVPTKRCFSIRKYGNESSFIYACIWRFKMCGPLIVINADVLPCLPTVPYIIKGADDDGKT